MHWCRQSNTIYCIRVLSAFCEKLHKIFLSTRYKNNYPHVASVSQTSWPYIFELLFLHVRVKWRLFSVEFCKYVFTTKAKRIHSKMLILKLWIVSRAAWINDKRKYMIKLDAVKKKKKKYVVKIICNKKNKLHTVS